MTQPPCYGCGERVTGCHATCKRYKDFKAIHAAECYAQRRQRKNHLNIVGYQIETAQKNVKRKRSRK